MKGDELRAFDNERILNELTGAHKEMFNLRFQKATGKLTNTARFKQLRKDIARMKTILRERELADEDAAQADG